MEDIAKNKRQKVLNYSLRLEAVTSYILSFLLDIDKYEDSKSFGNSSSSLSFNQKLNLLLDCKSVQKDEKYKFDAFMGIRNQFMHNLKCDSFVKAFDLISGLKTEVQKVYPTYFELYDDETALEFCVTSLFEDCAEILTAKKGLVEKKVITEAEHWVYKKIVQKLPDVEEKVFGQLNAFVLCDEFQCENKIELLLKIEQARKHIFENSIKTPEKF